jgi:predicted DNA-binding antitoxin AbrB/MazE fold protein
MSLTIEATYENGILKPLQPISLPNGTHVSIVVTPIVVTPHTAATTSKSPAEILAEIAALPTEGMDAETEAWLEADLGGDLPPYEWGNEESPTTR